MVADSRKLRFLITAGPTREYIDPVRYISNDSSGKMGFALAHAAAARGHRATLVHGPVALTAAAGVRTVSIVSAADMLAACLKLWPRHDVLIMAAAVADYAPTRPASAKLKKSAATRVLRLRPTPDVLATLACERQPGQTVIGFALEDRDARSNAERKLRRKRLDAIVLNRPSAIGADQTGLELLVTGEPWRILSPATKSRLATQLIRTIEQLHARP